MKKMVGFIGLAFLPLMVDCSLTARPSQWQPTAVTDFKNVGGKWEGQLIRDNHFTQNSIGRLSPLAIRGHASLCPWLWWKIDSSVSGLKYFFHNCLITNDL